MAWRGMKGSLGRLREQFVRKWVRSLKRRLTVALLLSSVVPLVLIGSISYYSILSILDNKISNGVRNHLTQVRTSLEYTLNNLNYAAQQLSYKIFTHGTFMGRDSLLGALHLIR